MEAMTKVVAPPMGGNYVVKGAERWHETDTGTYVIRDVFGVDRDLKRIFLRCEYATPDEDGKKIWKGCREGVSFVEIEPFKKAG